MKPHTTEDAMNKNKITAKIGSVAIISNCDLTAWIIAGCAKAREEREMTRTQREAIAMVADDVIREALLDIEHIEGLQVDVHDVLVESVAGLSEYLVAWYVDCHDRHAAPVTGCIECEAVQP